MELNEVRQAIGLPDIFGQFVGRGAPVVSRGNQPRSHQHRILGTMTGPLTRFSLASHEVHWRTAPGPGYSYL
jgi:hypothetical protein